MSSAVNGPRARGSYTVGFICALKLEMSAVRYLLDCEHSSLPLQPGDSNLYILGELSGYNIVLAWLPGNQGKGAAATVATNLNRSFPAIEWRFLVGIGGGVPSDSHDIRLGDVVISMPEGQHGGVVQYDLGKDEEEGFKLKGFLLPPPAQLRNAVVLMQSNHLIAENKIDAFISQMIGKSPRLSIYSRPPSEEDVLFAIDYAHDMSQQTCSSCDRLKAVYRRPRDADRPEIHYGLIASGDRVMRSAAKRQATVDSVGDILCFEMEAAGPAITFPCIAIRGISDYSDSHKNDRWQCYAAAAAAATAKELLSCIPGGAKEQARVGNSGARFFPSQRSPDTGPDPVTLQQSRNCAKSLAFEEMNNRINDPSLAAAEGTCKWLLQHEVYADWSTQHRALLWIKGKPGSGKSTLLRWLLDEKRKQDLKAGYKSLVLSFFFHGRGREPEKTPLGLFRSLLQQILSQVPEAEPSLIWTFQERCDTMGEPGKNWHWHLRELQEAFRSAISNILDRRTVWLFVDAVDECGKSIANELMRHFSHLLVNIPPRNSQFLICVTCRHYPVLDLGSTYGITLESENKEDISAYVRDRLSLLDEESVLRITDVIGNRADGIFMWASLQIDRVLELELDGVSLAKIEAEIRSTPRGLYSIYQGLVQNMNERSKSLKLIQWICFATRPLSLDELRWVLAVDADHTSPINSLKQARVSEEYIVSSEKMELRLKSLSCGLAEAVWSSGRQVAQFIHQSVRDFFVETGLSSLDDRLSKSENNSKCPIGMAHHQISRTCIRYVTMKEMIQTREPREVLAAQFPLLQYAALFWIEHAKKSEQNAVCQNDLLLYFDWPSPKLLQAWLRILGRLDHFLEVSPRASTIMLHILSQNQLISPLKLILSRAKEMDVDVNARDSSGQTPLLSAAFYGHAAVVELLLDADHIEINARDSNGRTPLLWAAYFGHAAVVGLLLDADHIDINATGIDSFTPLLWAAHNRQHRIVELLLATKKADINAKSDAGRTSLSYAAETGHITAIEVYITDNKKNIDLKDANGNTPLWYAARAGRTRAAELFIQAGADVAAASDSEQRTPLHVASRHGWIDVIRLLIENQADVGAVTRYGITPLHEASRKPGQADTVSMLIENLAEVGATDIYGSTPLHLAIRSGNIETVKLLLEAGADTHVTDGTGETPLRLARRIAAAQAHFSVFGGAYFAEEPFELRFEEPFELRFAALLKMLEDF